MDEIRVLIVEDEPLIAENIAMYLNNHDFKVSGIAYDDEEAFGELKNNPPDAVLLDVNLESPKNGIDIAEYINSNNRIPFVFLTSYSDKTIVDRAKKTNPAGYIVKPFNEQTLYTTLEIALTNFASRANQHVPKLSLTRINQSLPSPLSDREFEVIELIYDGKTNQQICDLLFIAMNTVKRHVTNAYFKLDVNSRSSAISLLRELMLK
ncbi:MAG: response regulator transcription factor [Chitinophagaceae bacterium]|nr:response regulator transcription factor [Chitinophagaceae bacterium]MBP6589771.1 response regulator transcription factor [Chitinophagaceae bacterium]MBP8243202.1 response regulator transcription factor [Chitinophagaceae bacterium]